MEKITLRNLHELIGKSTVVYYPTDGPEQASLEHANDTNAHRWSYMWIDQHQHKVARSLIGIGTYPGQTEERILSMADITNGFWWV